MSLRGLASRDLRPAVRFAAGGAVRRMKRTLVRAAAAIGVEDRARRAWQHAQPASGTGSVRETFAKGLRVNFVAHP